MPHAARIEALEVKIAHLEHALQQLSDVLYRQQQELDAQRLRLQRLLERPADAVGTSAQTVEIPPHY